MEKQNVTLALPKKLLKKAKMLAASQDKSVTQLLRESIEEKVNEHEGYAKARRRQKKILARGLNLGTRGKLRFSRDELHERR